uniref:Secreted protein n=1 Tax=Globodera pallida TaxID=36090 RepID=A0A183BVM9_GLOPA
MSIVEVSFVLVTYHMCAFTHHSRHACQRASLVALLPHQWHPHAHFPRDGFYSTDEHRQGFEEKHDNPMLERSALSREDNAGSCNFTSIFIEFDVIIGFETWKVTTGRFCAALTNQAQITADECTSLFNAFHNCAYTTTLKLIAEDIFCALHNGPNDLRLL